MGFNTALLISSFLSPWNCFFFLLSFPRSLCEQGLKKVAIAADYAVLSVCSLPSINSWKDFHLFLLSSTQSPCEQSLNKKRRLRLMWPWFLMNFHAEDLPQSVTSHRLIISAGWQPFGAISRILAIAKIRNRDGIKSLISYKNIGSATRVGFWCLCINLDIISAAIWRD